MLQVYAAVPRRCVLDRDIEAETAFKPDPLRSLSILNSWHISPQQRLLSKLRSDTLHRRRPVPAIVRNILTDVKRDMPRLS